MKCWCSVPHRWRLWWSIFPRLVKLRLITGSYLHFPGTLQCAAKLGSFCFHRLYEGRKQVKAVRFHSPFMENAPNGRLRDASLMSISWDFSRKGHRFPWCGCPVLCLVRCPLSAPSPLYQWQYFDNLVGIHCLVHRMVFALWYQPRLAESSMQN